MIQLNATQIRLLLTIGFLAATAMVIRLDPSKNQLPMSPSDLLKSRGSIPSWALVNEDGTLKKEAKIILIGIFLGFIVLTWLFPI